MLASAFLSLCFCYAMCLEIQQPVLMECSKRLTPYLPAVAEAGQGLGAVSVLVGSPHARTPACHAVKMNWQTHATTHQKMLQLDDILQHDAAAVCRNM